MRINYNTYTIIAGVIVFVASLIIIEKTKPKIMLKCETVDKVDKFKAFFLSLLFGSLASFCLLINKKETETKVNPLVFLN